MVTQSPTARHIAAILILVCCAWSAVAEEHQAIQQLDSFFGSYKLDEEGHVVSLQLLHGVSVFGSEIDSTIVCELLSELPYLNRVTLAEHQVDDDVLAHLGGLTSLQSLTLSNATSISNRGLRELLACKQLKTLYLPGCNLSDESLEVIGQITSLEDLGLRDNSFTDRGIGNLVHLKNLHTLYFRGSQFSGHGVSQLADLPLTTLGLGMCQIDDSAMSSIGKLLQLQSLFLDGASITDESLKFLEALPIENIGLSRTGLDDNCMNSLTKIKSLKHVWLTETKVTEASVDDLRQLENLEILMVPLHFSEAASRRLCKDRPQLSVLGAWNQYSWSRLRDISDALLEFHDTFEHFPSTTGADNNGVPRLSWRVAILPYLGEWELFDKFHFDEPWDGPHNITLLPLMPNAFVDPQRPTQPHHTVYQAAVGEMALLRETVPTRLTQATDGPENTILLVQTTSEAAVPWTAPEDYVVDLKNPIRDLIEDGRGLVVTAERKFRTFNDEIEPVFLRPLFTRDAND